MVDAINTTMRVQATTKQEMWMTAEYLLKWLEKEKILEFMLSRSTTHVELVRHMDVIFQFLDHLNVLDIKKHLNPLWQLTLNGQHEVFSFVVASQCLFFCVYRVVLH